jgi:hypothetical protein
MKTRVPFLLGIALLATGCREDDPTNVQPSAFVSITTGTPADRWEYLGRLATKYEAAEPRTPAQSRALLKAFTGTSIAMSKEIIADKTADLALREQATQFLFVTFARRSTLDPTVVDEALATIKQIEKDNPDSVIGTLAAGERSRILGQIAAKTPEGPEKRQKYAELVDAVIHTAGLKPPPEKANDVLANMAMECEKYRLFDLAQKIDKALIEKYPDDQATKFAKGALHRHESMGKVLDDLDGPGRDGKPVSIKDYRGKVVLVVFWSAFMEQMVSEIDEAEAMRQRYDPKDVEVLGVCLEPDPDSGDAFLKRKKIAWPQIISRLKNEQMESDLTLRFGVNLPSYKMVIDREGKLVDYGFLMSDVRPTLDKLLPKPKDPEPARTDKSDAAKAK